MKNVGKYPLLRRMLPWFEVYKHQNQRRHSIMWHRHNPLTNDGSWSFGKIRCWRQNIQRLHKKHPWSQKKKNDNNKSSNVQKSSKIPLLLDASCFFLDPKVSSPCFCPCLLCPFCGAKELHGGDSKVAMLVTYPPHGRPQVQAWMMSGEDFDFHQKGYSGWNLLMLKIPQDAISKQGGYIIIYIYPG